MFIKVFNSDGVEQGYLNLDTLDMFKVGDPISDLLVLLQVWKGTQTKTYYISNRQLEDLNDMLCEHHIY